MWKVTLGKYRLIAQIGRGGMADVYLAVTRESTAHFAKLVVIKRLKDELAHDAEFMTMLVDEARIAARLNHPNLVRTIELGEADGQHFLTMEYLDGQPLHAIVDRAGTRFPRGMVMSILVDVLAGIHYAHELKNFDGTLLSIVHRDVTPQNIFVTYEGQVKVVDFGIARAVGRAGETSYGVIKGKIAYMPPEQAGGMPIDRRADLYSIGVILFEAATGVRMWEGVSDTEVIARLVGAEIPSPKVIDAAIDDELDRICRKALAYVPDERYSTALEFQSDLEAYLATSGLRATPGEIGRFVAEHFAVTRAAMALLIANANVRTDRPLDSNERASGVKARSKRRLSIVGVAAFVMLLIAAIIAVAVLEAPSNRKTVTVTLRAAPPETRFSIDDGPPLENPFIGIFPEDGREHSVKAVAPGFTSKHEKIIFRSDNEPSLRLVLAPVARRAHRE